MDATADRSVILSMFSGGVDSTGALYQLLTNPKYQNFAIHVHHINIMNIERRAPAEKQAVEKIIKYLQDNVEKAFTYSENSIESHFLKPPAFNRFMFDMDVCAFMAGNICASNKKIQQVAMGRSKTDTVISEGSDFFERMKRAQKIFKATLSLENDYSPEYIFPVLDMTKQEIWEMMPLPLRQMTWWCRHPQYPAPRGTISMCGTCITCKQMNIILATGHGQKIE